MGCRGEGGGKTLSQFRVTHCREERRGEIRLYEDLETTRERGDDLQIENDHSIYRRVYLQFKSFLSSSLYIYIHLVLLPSACATTVLEEEISFSQPLLKTEKKKRGIELFIFIRLLLS